MSESDDLKVLPAQALSQEERSRILSITRLRLSLTVFVIAILLGLSAMIFTGVSRIFDWLTPSISADLTRKAKRGAIELSKSTELGIVVRDVDGILQAAADYISDKDVLSFLVLDASGGRLLLHGEDSALLKQVLTRAPGRAHDLAVAYGSWTPAVIEGAEVGRVVLIVSKARLEAGLALRNQILITATLGCLFALLVCLLFVNSYIGPILRLTGDAFVRLEQTTEAALAAARSKSQFLANTSHEIRTPMNGIIGVLDLLQRTELSPKQQRYTQIIDASARGLLTIINDVLDFSKLEAGKYTIHPSELEVRLIVQEVAELLAPRASDKKLELVVRIDADVPQIVMGDVDRVKQVLNNLLGNAIKFTDAGAVDLHVSLLPAAKPGEISLRFAVRDTGLGIRKQDLGRLFGVFSQVDGSLTRKHGGTGLGLAISKQLAEAMGGGVGVESEPGKGSTFWFTIGTTVVEAAPKLAPVKEANVLVVCPVEAQASMLRELIERWGMHCSVIADPAEACARVMSGDERFDVAVLDGVCDDGPGANTTFSDVCMGEGVPVIYVFATSEMVRGTTGDSQRNFLLKPLRASELYNGLLSVLVGESIQQATLKSGRPSTYVRAPARKTRVLIVDDNEINRLVATDLLTELGYPSDTACNGREAVEKVQAGNYGVVLMDCQMPELDGYEATRKIRALPEPRCKVPIIALTAHALTGDRERVLEAGMDDYTTKPIRVRTLEQLLLRWGLATDRASMLSAVPANTNMAALPTRGTLPPTAKTSELPDLDETLPRSRTVVDLFMNSMPALMDSLAAAMQRQDPSGTKQLAHKLKGNCLSLGANRMAEACHMIERAALAGELLFEAEARLPALFAAAREALERERAQPSKSKQPVGGAGHA